MSIETLIKQMNLDNVSAVLTGGEEIGAESEITIEAGSNEGFYLNIADHSLRIHGSEDEALVLLRQASAIIQSLANTSRLT